MRRHDESFAIGGSSGHEFSHGAAEFQVPSGRRGRNSPFAHNQQRVSGCMRPDIARFLGKRYQHVWNVLMRGRPTSEAAPGQCPTPDEPGDVEFQKIRLLADGRMVIPAKMRSAMLIDEGGYLTARVVEGELRVMTPKAAVLRLRKRIREEVPRGVSLVDDLIAERRAHARREAGE